MRQWRITRSLPVAYHANTSVTSASHGGTNDVKSLRGKRLANSKWSVNRYYPVCVTAAVTATAPHTEPTRLTTAPRIGQASPADQRPGRAIGQDHIYLTHYTPAAARVLYARYGCAVMVATTSEPRLRG